MEKNHRQGDSEHTEASGQQSVIVLCSQSCALYSSSKHLWSAHTLCAGTLLGNEIEENSRAIVEDMLLVCSRKPSYEDIQKMLPEVCVPRTQ